MRQRLLIILMFLLAVVILIAINSLAYVQEEGFHLIFGLQRSEWSLCAFVSVPDRLRHVSELLAQMMRIVAREMQRKSSKDRPLEKPVRRQQPDGDRYRRPQPGPTGADQVFDRREQQHDENNLPDFDT